MAEATPNQLDECFRYVLQKHTREGEARQLVRSAKTPAEQKDAQRALEYAGRRLSQAIREYHETLLEVLEGAKTT